MTERTTIEIEVNMATAVEVGEGAKEKIPFAFSKCKDIEKKGASMTMYEALCNICGKKVKATPHKMLYGHYLQKRNQNMAVQCVARSILERDHSTFLAEADTRWGVLEKKRGIKFEVQASENKKQKGIEDSRKEKWDDKSNGEMSEVPYNFLPAEEKHKRRDKCQTAWDKAFIVCGIRFSTADNPLFKEAVQLTRACPDFKLACSKTMRTSRLDLLHENANAYKERRMQAGLKFGFVITSDGWRSVAKRNYHNYILLSVEGPIFVELLEVTGEGGTGEIVHQGFEDIFVKLGREVLDAIVLGITDTPSANRKAWRLLEAQHSKQLWLGCAAHEVGLLFKERTKNVPSILTLYQKGLRIVKWVNNHSEILKLFREIVTHRFEDKRRHCLTLYLPGDTRFMTVFKMLQRILDLWDVLTELINRSEYETASQKALKQWSDSQPADKKLVQGSNGKFPDVVQHTMRGALFKNELTAYIDATKSSVFLLRLVDGHSPVLGKFYYGCALVDKHLRVLEEARATPYIHEMRAIFAKRWKRWHRPVHTLAYALDPC